MNLTVGTRKSQLAQWQTGHVADLLRQAWAELEVIVCPFDTTGDRLEDQPLPEIGGKGLFTAELEDGLREGHIDLAVHSLKDLPTQEESGISIVAVPLREDPRDVLVSGDGRTLDQLKDGAVVGTGSPRRAAQARRLRPDLQIRSIRGNVPTRVLKAMDGDFDAIILAAAGLVRLGMTEVISEYFEPERMLPAPGQGAIGVQCRQDDARTREILSAIDHAETHRKTRAERTFLATLQAGCASPVGAFARAIDDTIHLDAAVFDADGSTAIRASCVDTDPVALGRRVGERVLALRAKEVE